MKTPRPLTDARSKFGAHSYGSPQGAILGRWGPKLDKPPEPEKPKWPLQPKRKSER